MDQVHSKGQDHSLLFFFIFFNRKWRLARADQVHYKGQDIHHYQLHNTMMWVFRAKNINTRESSSYVFETFVYFPTAYRSFSCAA